MLVLSRKIGEKVMIGDDVQLIVTDIRGDRVRIGIVAPREIQVHRQEVYDAIKEGKIEGMGFMEETEKNAGVNPVNTNLARPPKPGCCGCDEHNS